MDQVERISERILPTLKAMGFELVRIRLFSGRSPTLQIMAERADGTMSIGDCTELSRALSDLFELEDPIAGAYRLEVSSPGIDRPLTRTKDYTLWVGHEAKIEMRRLIDGRKRFRGEIKGVEDTDILLEMPGEPASVIVRLPFAEIEEAKLVITDKLLKLAKPVDPAEFDDVRIEKDRPRKKQGSSRA